MIHQATVSAPQAAPTLIRFENDVFPHIGRLPVPEVHAPKLLALLRNVEARGAIETAHRIKGACGQVFRHGIATGQCRCWFRASPGRHGLFYMRRRP